ncbi:hypothetical protein [Candidatus Symbiopectobacterium sp. NZEC135]|uniref:hypothetical protein n=1 Tax=Candidatus Symbiopectobacterium sp. NZEC135 TaxID=2820471 RepID=UPI0039B684CA
MTYAKIAAHKRHHSYHAPPQGSKCKLHFSCKKNAYCIKFQQPGEAYQNPRRSKKANADNHNVRLLCRRRQNSNKKLTINKYYCSLQTHYRNINQTKNRHCQVRANSII